MIRLLIALIFLTASELALGAFIEWSFEANINATSSDPLSIHGEHITLLLNFDDGAIWSQIDDYLYISTLSGNASLSGGHTASLNTPTPAAFYNLVGSGYAAMSEESGVPFWLDFVIDGYATQMINFIDDTVVMPSFGETLSDTHLMDELIPSAGFNFVHGSNPTQYTFGNVSITTSLVPIPTTAWLFLSAIAGLYTAKRKLS